MFKASDNILFKCLYHIVWMVFFAKLLSLILIFALPLKIEKNKTYIQDNFPKIDIDLDRAFGLSEKAAITRKISVTKKPTSYIKDMILKGIYVDRHTSFAIISLNKNINDIKILKKDDMFNGYKIVKILPKRVYLKKNNKIYSLYFEKLKADKISLEAKNITPNKNNDFKMLKSQDVLNYTSHFDKIWKDISIDDIRDNGKLIGKSGR